MNTKKVTWEDVEKWTREVSEKILNSEWRPDVIIAISRGGFVPARLICDLLVVGELVSLQVTHWPSAAQIAKEAGIKYALHCDLSNKKALIVDDIADTGDSIIIAKDHVWSNCRPRELKVATLQWISKTSKIKPDYYAEEVKEWIWYQYPWTRLEDIIGFSKRIIDENKGLEWDVEKLDEKFEEYYGVRFDKWYYEKSLNYLANIGFLIREGEKYKHKGV
ncbi:MAG: phosphoribosyltransferase [Candidatus Methanomethyliaceae archaeon]|nr:phosphoribosyltransferase [Candidatus Methanomethyliaceae archaeon]MDW7971435.1 phosphoribosyltransferase [Nitrososphaerota archaeon]